jgi:hypothetical protein
MRKDTALPGFLFLVAVFLVLPGFLPCAARADEAILERWEEGAFGRWNSLPERKAEAVGDIFRVEVILSPGSGVRWEERVDRALRPEDVLSIEMVSAGTNKTSRDYDRYGAHFPLSVTAVFGEDSEDLSWKRRVADFFRAIWHGFSPRGIRLTFAYGNNVPVGSMYRLGEEETVFILGGEEERGKKILVARDLGKDFQAAYGRPPRGPLTRILVSAERPSREDGAIEGEIRLSSPLLK